jgi:hypothetical protein
MKYNSVMCRQTCELINLPPRNIHVSNKWTFKTKFATNGVDKQSSEAAHLKLEFGTVEALE